MDVYRGYQARAIPGQDGAVVLAPDGLTWASFHPTLEAAQAHALALNEWLDAKPDPDRVAPFFAPEVPAFELTVGELGEEFERILDRLHAPERMYLAGA
jgi:hypothetical protein